MLAGLSIRTIPLNPPADRMGRPAIMRHFVIVDYHVSIVILKLGFSIFQKLTLNRDMYKYIVLKNLVGCNKTTICSLYTLKRHVFFYSVRLE